jgi:hypothetical protein
MRALMSFFACIFPLAVSCPAFALGALNLGPLNDTGIDFCGGADSGNNKPCLGTEPAGQDVHYGRDKDAGGKGFNFTAIGANGSPTTPVGSVNPHPCVKDNVTGLTWEVKTDDGGLHDKDWTYTWYDTNSPDGNPGTAAGGSCGGTIAAGCDTEKFVAAVNAKAVALCGYRDWRMPHVKELEGIADRGRVNPAIDPTYFPNTPSSVFWSGSPYAYGSYYAWNVDFSNGYAYGYVDRYSSYSVRLVRGGQ